MIWWTVWWSKMAYSCEWDICAVILATQWTIRIWQNMLRCIYLCRITGLCLNVNAGWSIVTVKTPCHRHQGAPYGLYYLESTLFIFRWPNWKTSGLLLLWSGGQGVALLEARLTYPLALESAHLPVALHTTCFKFQASGRYPEFFLSPRPRQANTFCWVSGLQYWTFHL